MSDEIDRNSLQEFAAKFQVLAEEANTYGIHVVVLFDAEDPIAQRSVFLELYRASHIRCIGMLQQGLWHLEKGER